MNYYKYYLYKEQISYDDGTTWQDTGNQAPGGDPIGAYETYEQCTGGTPEIQYRWTQSGTTCIGYDKYQNNIKEQSTDGGSTWTVVIPEEYSASTLIETDSPDCGYVPPTPTGCTCNAFIFEGTSEGNNTYRIEIPSGETAVTAATWNTACGLAPGNMTHTDDSGFTEIVTDGHWTFDNNMIKFTASTNPTNVVREGYMTITYTVDGVSCEKRTHLVQAAGQGFNRKVKYTLTNSAEIITPCDTGSTVGRTIYSGSVVTAEIGNCVTSIGDWAFYGCTSLTGVTIPNNIITIGQYAFSGCTSLPSITIPDNVTTIGYRAFNTCYSLTSIEIPDSVRGIGDFTFEWCYNLTSCTIGNSVTSIGYEAFNTCYSLTSINLPNSLTSIDYGAFRKCYSLTGITIPDNVTSIGEEAFVYCSGLTSVTIGSGITSIGQYAFEGCTSFQSVTIKATTPPSIDWGTFPNGSYSIYVPSSSVSSYQDAYSAYSSIVSKIQPIS